MKQIFAKPNDNWNIKKLSELCLNKGVQTGPFGSQLHQKDYVKKGTPIITVEHLGELRIIHKPNIPKVSDKDKERLSKFVLKEGDIVLSRVGSVDISNIVTKDEEGWLFSGRCLRIRVDKNKIDPNFLILYLRHPKVKRYLRAFAVGATMPSINTKILMNLPITYPNKKNILEQKTKTLVAIDDKIEINKKMCQTLKETAKTIFKSWFVDFDPVKAKATGASIGISKEISDLFPDTFYDSKLGKIPSGLEIHKIGEIFNTVIGGTPSRKNDLFWEGSNGWINSGAINQFPLIEPSEYISDFAVKNSSTKFSKKKSTLIALVTEINLGLITFSEIDAFINQSIVAIQPNDIIFPEYVYLYTKLNYKRLYREQSGGAQQHINKNIVNNFEILKPHDEILEASKDIFKNIFEKIAINTKQNLILSNLRDTLLQQLIFGQLKASNISNFIEKKLI